MKFTAIGTDTVNESNVIKVNVSDLLSHTRLKKACTGVAIEKIWYNCSVLSVDILWDATANVVCHTLIGDGTYCFEHDGPLVNNATTGKTGDVLFTTAGMAVGARYTITLKMRKTYS